MSTSEISRRRALTLLVGGLALAGCADDENGAASSSGDSSGSLASPSPTATATTRTITHAAGTTEVPLNATRIVTLQDQNALLPLLELGVRPVASAGLLAEDGSRTFRRTEGFDTSGIEWIGEYGEPNLEAIAAARPDLIISDEFGGEGFYDELSKIAPTVFIQIFDERPLTEALMQFAEVVGREERAEAFRSAYEARIRALRERLGDDLERTTVSVLSAGEPGVFYQADTGGQAQFTVMRDLDLPRPPLQEDGSDEEFSLERLPEHDADVLIIDDYSGEDSDPGVEAIEESPLFSRLGATRAGQAYTIDATRSVGAAWARMNVFLDELERILTDPDLDRDVVDEAA